MTTANSHSIIDRAAAHPARQDDGLAGMLQRRESEKEMEFWEAGVLVSAAAGVIEPDAEERSRVEGPRAGERPAPGLRSW